MARLHEFQGKAILSQNGLAVPRGRAATSAEDAAAAARELGGACVVKAQAWTTGRAAMGGVAFADTPAQAAEHAGRILAMKVGNFPIDRVLVEEKLSISHELFVSLSIDDKQRRPVMLLGLAGGSGIEERGQSVYRLSCDVFTGPARSEVDGVVAKSSVPAPARGAVADAIMNLFNVARKIEARSLEINPLVVTAEGRVMAADCRVTVDDYAVFRHPELGIEIARELDHPPTDLERRAYAIEQADHRGTFFFAQMNTVAAPTSNGLIGFHGAGGGGSMMSMDAITGAPGGGFTIANFCDTSGNPSPAKVYHAARTILSQPGLVGYFGSGSGVANQEQYWSAYGLAKAFWEINLDIPAVIRLGGNTEDRAVEILESACKSLPARVEGYKKTDPPARIAARFGELVREAQGKPGFTPWTPRAPRRPAFVGKPDAARFAVKGGTVWIDRPAWKANAPAIIARSSGLLKDDGGVPALGVAPDAFAAKDSEMIACEVECRRDGVEGVFVDLEPAGGIR